MALQTDTAAGVTFCQVAPPSRVSCTAPSSVPAQITPSLTGDGAMVISEPSGFFGSFFSAGFSTGLFAGVRVRSGLIFSQLVPPLVVFSTNCVPRYRTCGSWGEKTMGIFQWKRNFDPKGIGAGEMSRT